MIACNILYVLFGLSQCNKDNFGKFDFEIWVEEEVNFPGELGHGSKSGQKLKSAPKTECKNQMKSYLVMPVRWSHAKVGLFLA